MPCSQAWGAAMPGITLTFEVGDQVKTAVTDANGVATFPNAESRDDYKVSFVTLPAGYDYVDENQAFYFAAGETEITLTLKAVA